MKRLPAIRLGDRFSGWLVHPRLPLHLALLAVLLCLPALGVGWQLDDYFHRVVLRGDVETGFSPLELFSVMRFGPEVRQLYVDLGIFPWWTSDGFRLAFFRYLSAATHWLDYQLWPESAPLQHVHSLLWFGALIFAAALLYRRIEGPTWAAGLAALLYAVDDAHGSAAGWLANRNALVATFFGVLCLLAHDRWRRSPGSAGRLAAILAPLCFALALAGGEMGLGAFAYLAAYTLFVDRGAPRQRLLSLLPSMAVLIAWAAMYRALGFGAAGSGLYVHPVGQPLEFLARLAERAPFYLAGQLTPLPVELEMFMAPGRSAAAQGVATVVLLVMAVVLAPLVGRDRKARFWALGTALAVVPLCATFPSGRVLFFVGIGALALVAKWLEGVWGRGGVWPSRWSRRLVAVGLVATHLVLAPLVLPLTAQAFKTWGAPVTEAILTLPDEESLAAGELVIVNAPDYLSYVSQASSVLLAHDRPAPWSVRGLAAGPSAVTVRRSDPRTLEVSMADGFLGGILGGLFRDPEQPFASGQTIELPGLTVEVLALTSDGRPATVGFRFDEPLESSRRRWVQFREGRFLPFVPPAVGDEVELPAALGPLDLL